MECDSSPVANRLRLAVAMPWPGMLRFSAMGMSGVSSAHGS